MRRDIQTVEDCLSLNLKFRRPHGVLVKLRGFSNSMVKLMRIPTKKFLRHGNIQRATRNRGVIVGTPLVRLIKLYRRETKVLGHISEQFFECHLFSKCKVVSKVIHVVSILRKDYQKIRHIFRKDEAERSSLEAVWYYHWPVKYVVESHP